MYRLVRLSLFIILFPVALQAQHKIGLELLQPQKPFTMKVGEPLTIEFKANTTSGDFFYVIYLLHADEPPWENGAGPLTVKPLPLKQGNNSFKWDGASFWWDPEDSPKVGKLKLKKPAQYYFNIYVFADSEVALLGMGANYHKKQIAKLRTKNFTIQ